MPRDRWWYLVLHLVWVLGGLALAVAARRARTAAPARSTWVLAGLLAANGLLGLASLGARAAGLGARAEALVLALQGAWTVGAAALVAWVVARVVRNTRRERSDADRGPGGVPTTLADPALEAAAGADLAANGPIHAIRRVRERTGVGLAEAKAYVDALGAAERAR